MPGAVHIDQWLQRAEPDFYAMFINVWIPFNAWYVHEYQEESDSTCLSQICSTENNYRIKIKKLLTDDTSEAKEFRYNIARLYRELSSHPIPAEAPLSFDNVLKEENKITSFQKDYRNYSYKWEYFKQTKPHCKCIVTSKNTQPLKTIVTIDLVTWNIDALLVNADYTGITNRVVQDKVREYFMRIRPYLAVPIVVPNSATPKQLRNAMKIDNESQLYFVNDLDKVSCAIVWMLYKLRCLIFHGNIGPAKDSCHIYEYAYNIQRVLIKALV